MIFVCDVMLGKLARHLRMLGLDAPYIRHGESLEKHLREENVPFVFFTKRGGETGRPGFVLVLGDDPREQLREIRGRIEPYMDRAAFMTRCIECNALLTEIAKEDIEPLVPEYVYHHHVAFRVCPSCRKVYWEGSHADDMHSWLEEFLRQPGS